MHCSVMCWGRNQRRGEEKRLEKGKRVEREGGERASHILGALSDASSDPETNLQANANEECAFRPEGSANML